MFTNRQKLATGEYKEYTYPTTSIVIFDEDKDYLLKKAKLHKTSMAKIVQKLINETRS